MLDHVFFNVERFESQLNVPSYEGKLVFDEADLALQYLRVELYDSAEDIEGDLIKGDKCGSFSGRYIDFDYLMDQGHSFESCFAMENDLKNMYNHVFEDGEVKNEYSGFTNNVFVLDKLYVPHNYRKQRIASFILENFDEILRYVLKLNIGIVIVVVKPYELDENGRELEILEDPETTQRIVDMFEKNGYETLIKNDSILIKRTKF